MKPEAVEALLEELKSGAVTVDEAMARLRSLPFEALGDITVDHHRALRCGFAEVVFCEGKSPEQISAAATSMVERGQNVLGTRVSPEQAARVIECLPDARYDPVGRTLVIERHEPRALLGKVLVVCAGTSDLPVAQEAITTARVLGCQVERLADVGVAGLHRLLAAQEAVREASVLIVVAGMEGALPSVVGGITDRPIIAVPTSVGYGASFGGVAALLGMLTSCAAGVTVVNIDNGFGAAYAAARILRLRADQRSST